MDNFALKTGIVEAKHSYFLQGAGLESTDNFVGNDSQNFAPRTALVELSNGGLGPTNNDAVLNMGENKPVAGSDEGSSCCNCYADLITWKYSPIVYCAVIVTYVSAVVLGATMGSTLSRSLSNYTAP